MNKLLDLIEEYGLLSFDVGCTFARDQTERVKQLLHQKAKILEEIQKIIETKEPRDV